MKHCHSHVYQTRHHIIPYIKISCEFKEEKGLGHLCCINFCFIIFMINKSNGNQTIIRLGNSINFNQCLRWEGRKWWCSVTRCFMDSRSFVFSFLRVSTSWAALEDLTPPTSSNARWASFSLRAAVRAWCLVVKIHSFFKQWTDRHN